MVQHPCMHVWSMANASLGNIHLFLRFLCHPYILTDIVENFYSSLNNNNNTNNTNNTNTTTTTTTTTTTNNNNNNILISHLQAHIQCTYL